MSQVWCLGTHFNRLRAVSSSFARSKLDSGPFRSLRINSFRCPSLDKFSIAFKLNTRLILVSKLQLVSKSLQSSFIKPLRLYPQVQSPNGLLNKPCHHLWTSNHALNGIVRNEPNGLLSLRLDIDQSKYYRSGCGGLGWLVSTLRPDCAYAFSKLLTFI